MLQRIQTIWLLLSVVAAAFLFITGDDVRLLGDIPMINIASILLVLIGVFSLLSYKKRKLQILLNNVSIIINVLLIGILSYWLLNLSGGINFPEKGIELIFPLIGIICLIIANVYIKKDEKLVKSVDRLR